MTNMNNTSLHDKFDAPIKADIESLRGERKATREADAILTNHLLEFLGENFEKIANNTNNSSAIPLSKTDKTEARKCSASPFMGSATLLSDIERSATSLSDTEARGNKPVS